MDQEQIKKIIEEPYDETREDTLRVSLKEHYKAKMRRTVIGFSIYCCVFYGLGIACGVMLLRTGDTRYQILFAALFLFFMQRAALVKTIGWQMLNKQGVEREVKRLEFRIAELIEIVNTRLPGVND